MSHLTMRGRLSVIEYLIRRMFIAPAPDGQRCFMGAPVDDRVHCPRRVHTDGMWCRWHERTTR